jgi:hypothetical protein
VGDFACDRVRGAVESDAAVRAASHGCGSDRGSQGPWWRCVVVPDSLQ